MRPKGDTVAGRQAHVKVRGVLALAAGAFTAAAAFVAVTVAPLARDDTTAGTSKLQRRETHLAEGPVQPSEFRPWRVVFCSEGRNVGRIYPAKDKLADPHRQGIDFTFEDEGAEPGGADADDPGSLGHGDASPSGRGGDFLDAHLTALFGRFAPYSHTPILPILQRNPMAIGRLGQSYPGIKARRRFGSPRTFRPPATSGSWGIVDRSPAIWGSTGGGLRA